MLIFKKMADHYYQREELRNILIDLKKSEKWEKGRTERRIKRYTKKYDEYNGDIQVIKGDDTQLYHQGLGDWFKQRKMPPYTKNKNDFKFERENKGYRKSGFPNTSKRHKEMVRNANRSKKKGLRQQYKKELQNELNEISWQMKADGNERQK